MNDGGGLRIQRSDRRDDLEESWEEKGMGESVFGGEPRRLEESQLVAEASKRSFVFFSIHIFLLFFFSLSYGSEAR